MTVRVTFDSWTSTLRRRRTPTAGAFAALPGPTTPVVAHRPGVDAADVTVIDRRVTPGTTGGSPVIARIQLCGKWRRRTPPEI